MHCVFARCVFLVFLTGCVAAKPCHEGGDVSWPTPIDGDRICNQKKSQSGFWVNHGRYVQKHRNGQIALEGEFEEGRKQGRWIQYDEAGNRVAERSFENGVETGVKDLTAK
jgi:hypothetical protein